MLLNMKSPSPFEEYDIIKKEMVKRIKESKRRNRILRKWFYLITYLWVFVLALSSVLYFFKLIKDKSLPIIIAFIIDLGLLGFWIFQVYYYRSRVIKDRKDENNEIIKELKKEGENDIFKS